MSVYFSLTVGPKIVSLMIVELVTVGPMIVGLIIVGLTTTGSMTVGQVRQPLRY